MMYKKPVSQLNPPADRRDEDKIFNFPESNMDSTFHLCLGNLYRLKLFKKLKFIKAKFWTSISYTCSSLEFLTEVENMLIIMRRLQFGYCKAN